MICITSPTQNPKPRTVRTTPTTTEIRFYVRKKYNSFSEIVIYFLEKVVVENCKYRTRLFLIKGIDCFSIR